MRDRIQRIDRLDIAAFVLFLGVFGWLFYTSFYGIGSCDEAGYYTFAQRILQGDRFMIDFWDTVQSLAVFELLPYKLCTMILSGVEGIHLLMRFAFLIVEIPVVWYLYRKLKKYRYAGLFAVLVFCTCGPIYAINYYTVCMNCVMIVCTAMCTAENPLSKPRLIVLGVLAALAVLAEPTLALLYFAYSALVLCLALRQKKHGSDHAPRCFVLALRTWGFLTIGILLCAAAFLLFVLCTSNIPQIIRTIPEILNHPFYSFNPADEDNHFRILMLKIYEMSRLTHPVPLIALLLIPVIACICNKRRDRPALNTVMFVLSCFCLIVIHCRCIYYALHMYNNYRYSLIYLFYPVPTILFALCCCSLIRNEPRDRGALAFLCTGLAVSLCIDIMSGGLLCAGGPVAQAAAVIFFCQIVQQFFRNLHAQVSLSNSAVGASSNVFVVLKAALRDVRKTEQANRMRRRIGRRASKQDNVRAYLRYALLSVFIVSVTLSSVLYAVNHVRTNSMYLTCERDTGDHKQMPLDQMLERGPMKGIRTNAHVKALYDAALDDLDVIKSYQSSEPLLITNDYYIGYLYAQMPYSTCISDYNFDGVKDRLIHFWALVPEKIPGFIYLARYDHTFSVEMEDSVMEEELSFYTNLFDCEIIEGKVGTILRVHGVRDHTILAADPEPKDVPA